MTPRVLSTCEVHKSTSTLSPLPSVLFVFISRGVVSRSIAGFTGFQSPNNDQIIVGDGLLLFTTIFVITVWFFNLAPSLHVIENCL